MTVEAVVSRLDSTKNPNLASLIPSSPDGLLTQLRRIETILRNGLPHSDKDIAGTIAHAHSEIELLLESIDEERWLQ